MAGVSHRGELIRDGCCTMPPAAWLSEACTHKSES
jgi:hypothetical protein